MIAWVHISTALQSALTPTARYAASTNPWRETIQDTVLHYLTRRNMSDTGRPGQRWWKIDFIILLVSSPPPFCEYSLALGLYIYFDCFFCFSFLFSFFFKCNFFLCFTFYRSHKSMINTQCTCHYLLTYLLTYSMVQSPSWEANWSAASQEILRISRNPKVHYRTHKRPPPASILGQPNPVPIHTSHFLEIHPNIIHLSISKIKIKHFNRIPHVVFLRTTQNLWSFR